ncbi:RluA family pseudouridine synthase [Maridesulfovibrio hydrothermalis]|uniref:Ribosomal large subunit pseudouridine synthase A n=1 Tax=Maridesulfovibrio hydrothermalis AM13 = DSM 14728 TaxID=1121451 RepID=L0R9R5_9BACT|nr:RluA family pseudouridine synthase [Maridesulfovibrio hydrothermalis]CCO23489.1 Ribosomal large subunit pseudouridine synthase A [Maridesulfovibrio hydrothermalis AM13 = DSM 14728]
MNNSELLDIVYSDNKIVVVNKPSGLLSVPGRGPENQDCVVTRVQKMFPDCRKFPTVHRLDMDTSGLLVLGLTARAVRELVEQFQLRQVKKKYEALLEGILKEDRGIIKMAFRLDPYNRPYQVFDPIHGKLGVTHWRKLGIENGMTRVEFTPLTGRTHQLRVHSAHPQGLGFPIAGDRLYGTGTAPGQLKLHARYLSFTHPKTKEVLEFDIPPLF